MLKVSRSWFVLMLVPLTACLPDETLELYPSTGATGGATGGMGPIGGMGAGGAGGSGCHEHAECTASAPYCDPVTSACSACPPGLELCGGSCVDTQRDAQHCGGCFEGCHIGEACSAATCNCLPGLERCGDSCVDPSSDVDHCGVCDHPCLSGERCEESGCHLGLACEGALLACDSAGSRVACVDAHLAPRCGGCEFACGPSETCVVDVCCALSPATPCESCPCLSCDALPGDHGCCEDVVGQSGASCVAGDHCPG